MCTALATGLTVLAAPLGAASASASPIAWEKCPPHVTEKGAQCGRVEVPMDYANPEGEKITIGFVRVPAKNPAARRGTIFTNPGGPGVDAYGYISDADSNALWPQEVLQEFDMVAVQPRGLRHSTPLECPDPEEPANPQAMLQLQYDVMVRPGGFIRTQCEQGRPGYTRTITTENNVRDWEQVRQALGEEQISIIGASYGTYLGSAYATAYPEHTDRLVLDSAADPAMMWTEIGASQELGFQRALNDYFEWVAANDDTLHMGDTPLKAYQYWYNQILAETGTNPTVTPPPARIGDLPPGFEFTGQAGANAITATGKARVEAEGVATRFLKPGANQANSELYLMTYQLLPVPMMWEQIARATNGSLQEENKALAEEMEARGETMPEPDPALVEEYEGQSIAQVMLMSVQACNEGVANPDLTQLPKALWARQTGNAFEAPFATMASGLQCNGAAPITGTVPLDGSKLATRPLQFNGTGDPQTIFEGRFGIAEPMNAHLVTVHGPGHGHVGTGNKTVDQAVVEYLRNAIFGPLDLPGFFQQPAMQPEVPAEVAEEATPDTAPVGEVTAAQ
ncbi:alpha/beta hydrolase [Corynebacterium sp. TA-R-1]|uniref:Alpha/beta hydrolase n=1 Tax=Corynebacterium stercoris TaxID=2943490 RepID=A0ABT1G049_9CORY|nr:alpha/beta fold hydrolase [Corynebacterium stercoris]MCP1387341.1 alpha/beta hydrolase [Corynebacterium stercoris]